MDKALEQSWEQLLQQLYGQYGEIDLEGILFLIGVQELGKGYQRFTKDQKLDVMHIAICTLLAPYGYYEYEGMDSDGWPHWNVNSKLPPLQPKEQNELMKRAIIDYFEGVEN